MSGRGLLRATRFAPLVAALLLAVVWFSVPGPLAVKMLTMTVSGVPVGIPEDPLPSRTRTALDFIEKADFERASKRMADIRVRDAARRTWLVLRDSIAAQEPTTATPSANSFRLLEEFSDEFPDVHVDAFVIPRPEAPSVIESRAAEPDLMPGDPFRTGWRAENEVSRGVFDHRRWKTDWTVSAADTSAPWRLRPRDLRANGLREGKGLIADHTSPGIYAHTFWFGTDAYRAYTFGASLDSKGKRFRHKRAVYLRGFEARVNDQTCHMCHGGGSDRKAIYIGGPVRFEPRAVYSSRETTIAAPAVRTILAAALDTTQTAAFPLEGSPISGMTSDDEDRWMSFVWTGRSDWHMDGQTMLFVASYPGDPHGAYEAWRTSPRGQLFTATRLWLALRLPWLLAIAGTLLGVSLIASPIAFTAERRLVTRERLQAELGRVQRDAHDRVYNRLTALAKRVDEAAADQNAVTRLDTVADDIRATVGDLQTILGEGAEHRQQTIDGSSLPVQLHAVAVAQGPRHGIDMRFESSGDPGSLPARLGWDLQCVLEEAVTNAARHGRACVVMVRLSSERDRLELHVIDDGRGLSQGEATGAKRSTGLAGMRERLGRWGGTVQLESREVGAELVAQVPLPPKRERAL